jgi:aspartate racemase
MLQSCQQELWGILGGLGPLASAEFLNTIYKCAEWDKEQDAPRLILLSDPTFHDRTESFLQGREDVVRCQLEESLLKLKQAGATRVVICCVTMHYLLPKLLLPEICNVISLIDVALQGVIDTPGKHLLMCTRGAMQLQIFQRHPLWPLAAPQIVVPHQSDWETIHDLIYSIKQNQITEHHPLVLRSILERYGVQSFIAACTELHVLTRYLQQNRSASLHWVDPLELLARRIVNDSYSHYAKRASPVFS